jgi:hypothetical protein
LVFAATILSRPVTRAEWDIRHLPPLQADQWVPVHRTPADTLRHASPKPKQQHEDEDISVLFKKPPMRAHERQRARHKCHLMTASLPLGQEVTTVRLHVLSLRASEKPAQHEQDNNSKVDNDSA